jgi:glycosyltransferase involved in cell wall biosynthesis
MTDRPRVLVYRDFLLPGSETFIRSQAEGLRHFEAYYGGLTRVDGIALPSERVVTVRSGKLGPLQSALFTRLGLTPDFAYRVWRLGPKLVHAHFGVDGTRVMRLARRLRLPLLVTLHDYDITTSDADLLKLAPYCERYIARRPRLMQSATAFLAVSEFIKRKAIERGFPAHKILVHYIGIDTTRFTPRLDRTGTEPLVLFVGRLVQKKGCADLIRAMQRVQSAQPDAKLVIIGDGPLRAELEAQAAATLRNYQFLGAQPSDQVRSWYERARLFCAPSVTADSGETEGLPITVLEAQAMGLPVVSTIHSGIPEAISNDVTGLLVAEHDSGALGDALTALLADPERATRLGTAARASVLSRFDMSTQIGLLESVYDQLAQRPSEVPTLQRQDG